MLESPQEPLVVKLIDFGLSKASIWYGRRMFVNAPCAASRG